MREAAIKSKLLVPQLRTESGERMVPVTPHLTAQINSSLMLCLPRPSTRRQGTRESGRPQAGALVVGQLKMAE